MKVVVPQANQGWAELMMNPRFNGGDEVPPGSAALVDHYLESLPLGHAIGYEAQGRPSVLWMMTPSLFGGPEYDLHWVNDGRLPLAVSFGLVDALARHHPALTFHAYARRPALARLLSLHGFTARWHEDEPFLMLMERRATASHLTPQSAGMNTPHAPLGDR